MSRLSGYILSGVLLKPKCFFFMLRERKGINGFHICLISTRSYQISEYLQPEDS